MNAEDTEPGWWTATVMKPISCWNSAHLALKYPEAISRDLAGSRGVRREPEVIGNESGISLVRWSCGWSEGTFDSLSLTQNPGLVVVRHRFAMFDLFVKLT